MSARLENYLHGVILSAAVVACGEAPARTTGATEEAIVNGELDTTRHAVVLVALGQGLCSGTIIDVDPAQSLGIVLTAAHCVLETEPYGIIQGTDPADPDATYRVLDFEAHPAYVGEDYDIGVIRFVGADETTPRIEPVRAIDDDTVVGDDVTAVGYGRTLPGPSANFFNERHFVGMSVIETTPTNLVTTGFGSTCSGDSGGPVLRTFNGQEKVVAVHSSGTGTCLLTANESRVGSGEDFIDAFVQAPVGESCERCYKTLLSSTGACARVNRTCNESPACVQLASCLDGCDDTACVHSCAAEHPGGLDAYIEYGGCTCDPCDLCDGNDFCSRIEDLRADPGSPLGKEEPMTDAGDVPTQSDGGTAVPDIYATGGGGCECRAGGPFARRRGGGAWLLAAMAVAVAGARRFDGMCSRLSRRSPPRRPRRTSPGSRCLRRAAGGISRGSCPNARKI